MHRWRCSQARQYLQQFLSHKLQHNFSKDNFTPIFVFECVFCMEIDDNVDSAHHNTCLDPCPPSIELFLACQGCPYPLVLSLKKREPPNTPSTIPPRSQLQQRFCADLFKANCHQDVIFHDTFGTLNHQTLFYVVYPNTYRTAPNYKKLTFTKHEQDTLRVQKMFL